jgi:hypothetical protein
MLYAYFRLENKPIAAYPSRFSATNPLIESRDYLTGANF